MSSEHGSGSLINVPETIYAIRHEIHKHPELAFEEHSTANLIAESLQSWGLEVHRGLAGTGVVGVLRSQVGTRSIGLRADMDALPIQEKNQFSHASVHAGKMHACGHDGHCAMLLAAAQELSRTRSFDGTVYFIFQPAEERDAGALQMIKDGLFERFPMDAIFGMHNWPGLPVGQFSLRPGAMMASDTEFRITVTGKGGHAALPQQCTDPIPALAHLVQAIPIITTRSLSPLDPVVLSITHIHTGTDDTLTVIPDQAQLGGIFRAFSRNSMTTIETQIRHLALHVSQAFHCDVQVQCKSDYPPLINHAQETELCVDVLRKLVGPCQVVTDAVPTMASEDFAHMLEHTPGCYVFIGNGASEQRGLGHGDGPCVLHSASFDFNDDILALGATYWVRLVETYLPHTEHADNHLQ